MIRRSILMTLALVTAACEDYVRDVGPHLPSQGEASDTNSSQRQDDDPIVLEDKCEGTSEGYSACILDSKGNTFAVDGTLYVLPLRPPYGLNFRFTTGIKLTDADLSSEGAIKVYAAPSNVASGCLPEEDENNRIKARVVLTKQDGMLVLVDDELPSGTQVAVTLQFAPLLKNHFPLPNSAQCQSFEECQSQGFSARFYVGAEPPLSAKPGKGEAASCGK